MLWAADTSRYVSMSAIDPEQSFFIYSDKAVVITRFDQDHTPMFQISCATPQTSVRIDSGIRII